MNRSRIENIIKKVESNFPIVLNQEIQDKLSMISLSIEDNCNYEPLDFNTAMQIDDDDREMGITEDICKQVYEDIYEDRDYIKELTKHITSHRILILQLLVKASDNIPLVEKEIDNLVNDIIDDVSPDIQTNIDISHITSKVLREYKNEKPKDKTLSFDDYKMLEELSGSMYAIMNSIEYINGIYNTESTDQEKDKSVKKFIKLLSFFAEKNKDITEAITTGRKISEIESETIRGMIEIVLKK